MSSTRFANSVVGVILTIGTFGFVGALTAAAAYADTADEQYLGALEQQGISFGTTQGAIGIAHHVCDTLDSGMEPRDISDHIAAANSRIDRHTALVIVVDAATSYCPQFVHQMANGATVVGPNH
jgi:Protein of unknown function (DUF732)